MNSNRRFMDFGNWRTKYRIHVFFYVCFAVTAMNCMARGSDFEVTELSIETVEGNVVKIIAEMARTKPQLEQGLMNRNRLADGKGMIFIFERDQILSFWMKNTRIPLSIAFISVEGKILEIHDMEPFNLTPVHSSRSARFALEVPQSWFNRVGIQVGDRLLGSADLTRKR